METSSFSLCQKLYARNIKLLVTPPLVAVRESIAKTVERADLKAFPRLQFCGRTSERNLENGGSIQCSLQRIEFHSDSFFMRISMHISLLTFAKGLDFCPAIF